MTEVRDDISERVSGHVQNQIEKNEKKQAEADRTARRTELKGPAAWVAVVVGLLVIAGSAWYGWDSTRPPGFVRLLECSEKVANGKPTLVGKVKNNTRRVLENRTWIITYTDHGTTPPKTVVEANLVLSGVKPGETGEWTLEIPGWREGLKRVIRPKQ